MKRKIFGRIFLVSLIIVIMLIVASCSPKYETITQNPGSYKYSLGEKVEITDIETGDEIAELTVLSCELVKSEPFMVVERRGDDTETDKYTALYKLNYTFSDDNNYVKTPSANFISKDKNFVVNPTGEDEENGVLYVGAKKGNDNDSIMTIGFKYDAFQNRPTATFDIKIDDIPKEKSFEDCEVIAIGASANSKISSFDDSKDELSILAVILGIIAVVSLLFLPIMGIVGFAYSISNARRVKNCNLKIRELEYKINLLTMQGNTTPMPPCPETEETPSAED